MSVYATGGSLDTKDLIYLVGRILAGDFASTTQIESSTSSETTDGESCDVVLLSPWELGI